MPTDSNVSRMSTRQLFTWLMAAVAALVIVLAFGAGFTVAHGNSDIICTRTFQDSGSCTDGSWGPWATVTQSADQNTCQMTYQESRIYTGLRNTIIGDFTVRANLHTHCALSDSAFTNGSGSVTSQYSACQIQESRTRVVAGNGSGASCKIPTSNTGANDGTITLDQNTETIGAVDSTKTESVSGTYQLYLDMIDARLATSSIRAFPQLLHRGATTAITWTSSHTKSCVVTSTNGDTWPKSVTTTQTVTDADGNQVAQQVTGFPPALSGSEVSSPINGQTVYTLTCMTALNRPIITTTTVNLIPVFQEN